MVYENLPMEMSPEWKAITKCESRIEALEQKVDLLIIGEPDKEISEFNHNLLKKLSAKDEKPPEPFGMKGDFKREEVHQLILEAVKNGNNILIAEFIDSIDAKIILLLATIGDHEKEVEVLETLKSYWEERSK